MKRLDPSRLLRSYRRAISPVLHAFAPGSGCRFEPTCSAYFEEAVRSHGWSRGSWLGLKRVLRCQPWSRGGEDPVPPVSGGLRPSTKV